jgi:hypothetical protein
MGISDRDGFEGDYDHANREKYREMPNAIDNPGDQIRDFLGFFRVFS